MERIYFINHKGKKVLIEDLTNIGVGPEYFETLDYAQKLIASQPEKSVLAVLDATGARFNREVLARLKTFVNANTPYIKSASVVGVEGLLNVALSIATTASGRSFKLFKTRQEALDWIVNQ